MQQIRTAKIQIYPDERQKQLLLDTMRRYADACSYVSAYIYDHQLPLKQSLIHNQIYYYLRSAYDLPSQMSASVIRTVIASWKALETAKREHSEKFRKNRQKKQSPSDVLPEFKIPQLSLVWNRDYSLNAAKAVFSVGTLDGRVKVPFAEHGMEWAFADTSRFGTAKLVCKHGKFFLHVPVSCDVPDAPGASEFANVVGIDRGIRFLASCYDSKGRTAFYSGRQIKNKKAQYKQVRKELQKRHTASARRRLKRIGQRENRWMNDVNHCVSKALVESNPQHTLFVLEDLTGIRSATEKVKRKDRYILVSWSYYDLEEKLKYKALKACDAVISVNPAYTSQTCPRCGHVAKANRNHRLHLFKCCNCGYTSNDDRIAAMNLQRMGIEYLLERQSDAVSVSNASEHNSDA